MYSQKRRCNFAENRSAKAGESEKKIFAIRRSEAKANFFVKKRKKATKNRNSAKRKRKIFLFGEAKIFHKKRKKAKIFFKKRNRAEIFRSTVGV